MSDKLQSGEPEDLGRHSWQLPASPFAQAHTEQTDAVRRETDLSHPQQPSAQDGPHERKKPTPIPWDSVPTPQIGKQKPLRDWPEFKWAEPETDQAEPSEETLPEGPEIEIPSAEESRGKSDDSRTLSASEQMLRELDALPREEGGSSLSSLMGYDAVEDDEDDEDGEDAVPEAVELTEWPPQDVSEDVLYRDLNMRGLLKDLKQETYEDEAPAPAEAEGEGPAEPKAPDAPQQSAAASLLAEVEAVWPEPENEESGGTQDKKPRPKTPRNKRKKASAGADDRAKDGKPWKRKRFWKTAAAILAPLLAVVIVFQFIGFAVIDGASMTPSLSEHDFLVYWKFPGEIQRGDVLLSRSAGYNNQILAKRVIGLPGDVVEVDAEGHVLLNGEPYNETTAVYGQAELESDVRFPIRVEDGHYFLLGDNRAVSIDSRQSAIGQIAREDILGKVVSWFHIE